MTSPTDRNSGGKSSAVGDFDQSLPSRCSVKRENVDSASAHSRHGAAHVKMKILRFDTGGCGRIAFLRVIVLYGRSAEEAVVAARLKLPVARVAHIPNCAR